MTNNAAPTQTTSAPSHSTRKPHPTTSPSAINSETDEELTPSLLAQAETVRESLSQALTDVRELITAIKRNQKQNRLVETTRRSLKQLKEIGS